jgi:choline dehydrogenase-like flavoprotein
MAVSGASLHFDILVVGGGSAGVVMSARLTESGDQSVLLLP